jgi:undecaprenyl diphosphate synthase
MIQHLACQMDGNRRWAEQHGLSIFRGYDKGAQAIKPIARFCIENGIPFLSLYAFSTENFKNRSEIEKAFVFNLIAHEIENNLHEFIEHGMRIRFIGDRSLFPAHLAPIFERVESSTQNCTALNLNFLFCYGATQEITHAAQELARQVQAGIITVGDITPELFARHLWTGGMPNPEIVIRPGARHRLSNFLLFQSSYSEFFFLDTLWPDMTPDILETSLQEFKQRRRNFGK